MPPVFGRNNKPHPYDKAIAEWLAIPTLGYCAMARNLMHDHRVSEAREKVFDEFAATMARRRGSSAFAGNPPTREELEKAIVDYFEEKVRNRHLPHYVYGAINSNNLIVGNGSVSSQGRQSSYPPNRDVKLVRVLDLTGLGSVFQWAKRKNTWRKLLARFPNCPPSRIKPHDEAITSWLDEKLERGSERQIEGFIASVLKILNEYRQDQAFQPTWATTWSAFEPNAEQGPDRWLQVLGMAKHSPRWVMLLRYKVREAGTIARPTQLDAGWYAYHYPSPPQAPLAIGGHPMDLGSRRAGQLLPEYIHKQIGHKIDHWFDSGRKIGKTTQPVTANLVDLRRAHHELLVSKYGANVLVWMPDPI